MLRKKINKEVLRKDYPFNINEIISKCKEFEIKCRRGIITFKTLENASDSKNLILEILSNLLNKLGDLELAKSDTERESWYKLQRDVSAIGNFLDLREKELISHVEEGKELSPTNLIILLGDYMGVYRTMILNVLKETKDIYFNSILPISEIKDKKRAIFWVVYDLMRVNAGIYEMRINLSSGGSKTTKSKDPWSGMLVQSMRNELRETREMRMKQMLGEEVMKLVEKFNIPLSEEEKNIIVKEQGLKEKNKKDKSQDENEDNEDYSDQEIEEMEEPLQEPKSKKPKTGGKKMEDDFDEDKESDDEEPDDDGDWE